MTASLRVKSLRPAPLLNFSVPYPDGNAFQPSAFGIDCAVMNQDRKPSLTYRDAGLDLALYEQSLAGIAPFLKRTHTPRVLPPAFPPRKGGKGAGGFASLFSLDFNSRLFAKNYRHPVLVTCTDGVGSKLKIAALMNKHDTVGIDLVAMSMPTVSCLFMSAAIFSLL